MTIFIIARGTPTKKEPQWGCFEFDQAKALAALGHKVVYLSVDSRFRLYFRKIGTSKFITNDVHTYNSFLLPHVIAKLGGEKFAHQLRIWQLEKLYLKAVQEVGKPDILYSHYLFCTYESTFLRNKYNIPLVAIEHWSDLQKENLSEHILQMAGSYQYADKVIAVSQSLQKTLYKRFGINACVVNNMVGDVFSYERSMSFSVLNFVTTGSLIHRKGYDLLIQAFAKAQLPNEQWHLNIIGSGEEKSHLQQQIEQNNLQDNITLAGQKSKEEIVAIYQQSDIFVLPSRSETFGVVYIEAMACGLPVIATPCGGPEEFVTDKDGLLVPVDNVEKLAEAIKYMFHHYQEYDRKAIADNCQARFSSKVIAKQLTRIFEDVLAKHHIITIN